MVINIAAMYPKPVVGFRGSDTGVKKQILTPNVSQTRDLFRERRPAFGVILRAR